MLGNVIREHVKDVDEVSSGQLLLVMEAMKIEHNIVVPTNVIMDEVIFQLGDLVQNDARLVEFSLLEE